MNDRTVYLVMAVLMVGFYPVTLGVSAGVMFLYLLWFTAPFPLDGWLWAASLGAGHILVAILFLVAAVVARPVPTAPR